LYGFFSCFFGGAFFRVFAQRLQSAFSFFFLTLIWGDLRVVCRAPNKAVVLLRLKSLLACFFIWLLFFCHLLFLWTMFRRQTIGSVMSLSAQGREKSIKSD